MAWFAHGTASWLLWPPIVFWQLSGKSDGPWSIVCWLWGTPLMGIYVTASLLAGYTPPGIAWLTRLQKSLAPWAMLDVYMLAVLATLAKLASMATIKPGPGAWAFVALMLITAGANAAFDDCTVWQRLDAAEASA
jgi:paraquat-inducible protein A